jgi:hypothetical protein
MQYSNYREFDDYARDCVLDVLVRAEYYVSELANLNDDWAAAVSSDPAALKRAARQALRGLAGVRRAVK